MSLPMLNGQQIEQICHIFADTDNGFTGSQIGHMLAERGIPDPDPGMTKWKRLYNAFCQAYNNEYSANAVYKFLQYSFNPANGLQDSNWYQRMLFDANRVLMLVGVEIRDDGQFH